MKIHKNGRKILKLAVHSSPTIQGKAYDPDVLFAQLDMDINEFRESLRHLESEGAIRLVDKSFHFRLNAMGAHYREFFWIDLREFLFKSLLVPIVVSVVTTIITTLVYNYLT